MLQSDNICYPMLLCPAVKDYLWGGSRLKTEYGKHTDCVPLAETWECSVHPDGPSVIRNGVFQGRTLLEVLEEHGEYLGNRGREKEFPILVKFIDANQDLSVQVHPDDMYAKVHEGQKGKTEFWYVLDCEKDAKIIYGFEHKVSKEQLAAAISSGEIMKHLKQIPVKKGDLFYIPAGTVHAIGKGVVVAEIQENSNVTYRVYDYERTDKKGNFRKLHFDKAIEVMNMNPVADRRQPPRLVKYSPGCSREILCRCSYFEVEKLEMNGQLSFGGMNDSFQVLLCLNGSVELVVNEKIILSKGDCCFLPCGLGKYMLKGRSKLLKINC